MLNADSRTDFKLRIKLAGPAAQAHTVTDEATNGNERFMRDFVDGDCEADVIDEIQLAEISQLVRSESEVQAAQGARS